MKVVRASCLVDDGAGNKQSVDKVTRNNEKNSGNSEKATETNCEEAPMNCPLMEGESSAWVRDFRSVRAARRLFKRRIFTCYRSRRFMTLVTSNLKLSRSKN